MKRDAPSGQKPPAATRDAPSLRAQLSRAVGDALRAVRSAPKTALPSKQRLTDVLWHDRTMLASASTTARAEPEPPVAAAGAVGARVQSSDPPVEVASEGEVAAWFAAALDEVTPAQGINVLADAEAARAFAAALESAASEANVRETPIPDLYPEYEERTEPTLPAPRLPAGIARTAPTAEVSAPTSAATAPSANVRPRTAKSTPEVSARAAVAPAPSAEVRPRTVTPTPEVSVRTADAPAPSAEVRPRTVTPTPEVSVRAAVAPAPSAEVRPRTVTPTPEVSARTADATAPAVVSARTAEPDLDVSAPSPEVSARTVAPSAASAEVNARTADALAASAEVGPRTVTPAPEASARTGAVEAEVRGRTEVRVPAAPASKPAPAKAAEAGDDEPGEEPIRTRSMARLLAGQGHRRRALAIYDALLEQNADDAGLRAEAEALRQASP